MMDAVGLSAWMRSNFTRTAFRLETLQVYEVASDGSDYRRYLDGEPTWTPERKQPWLEHLTAEVRRGLPRSRVRVVTHPITPYTRYECEWGYAPNVAAGEDVRILDVTEHDVPELGEIAGRDWWYVVDTDDAARVATMHYGDDGQFVGATEIVGPGVASYRVAVTELWAAAEPFTTWWGRHPELRRSHAAS